MSHRFKPLVAYLRPRHFHRQGYVELGMIGQLILWDL